MSNKCDCFYNPDTGFFEPCCEKHEQEYIEYLEMTRSGIAKFSRERPDAPDAQTEDGVAKPCE